MESSPSTSSMQIPHDTSTEHELISPIGYANSSKCGYCGASGQSQSKSYAYYANATSISTKFYQILLDRSWRRSGKLLYRPNQRRSCCPHYTIRLDSSNFKPTRDQRQTINRLNKFVVGDSYIKDVARLFPKPREETRRRDNEFCLVDRVHESEYSNLKKPPEPAHRLVITLEKDDFTVEKYQVYDNYQSVVHKDPPQDRTSQAFKRFLCTSPLRREVMITADGRERKLGSYHQCYRLDGALVAIGVIDLLPECVSSVYFMYHESIHRHAPGKFGALQEIALASEEGYRWWYPGFYIHDCPKMRYKIDFSPQQILDPVSLEWVPLDSKILSLLDHNPFLNLSPECSERDVVGEMETGSTMSDTAATSTTPLDEEAQRIENQGTKAGDGGQQEEEGEDGYSLFRSKMPGIKSIREMMDVNLDHIAIKLSSRKFLLETSDLRVWESEDITDWPGIKASVAELIAAIGPDLCDSICLDITR